MAGWTGRRSTSCRLTVDDELLESVWRAVQTMHEARLAHRVLRGGNLMLDGGRPMITGLGSGVSGDARPARHRSGGAAHLVGRAGRRRTAPPRRARWWSRRIWPRGAYLQPLALSAATRKPASKALLKELRAGLAEVTGVEPPELAQLVRVRPRTLVTVVALTAAFYVLLPQLADVDDSVRAMRDANWGWLAVST